MMSFPDFQYQQIAVAFLSRGEKISFKNDNIIITDKEGKIKHQSTCYKLFTLFVVGQCLVTSGLLQRAVKFNFNLIFMKHSLVPYACFNAKTEGNVLLRHKQYAYSGFTIAQYLVENKVAQQLAVINNKRNKTSEHRNAIEKLKKYKSSISEQEGLQDLLGIEGVSSRVYFNALFSNNTWRGRKPRAKQDSTNTLLDIGYTLLFNFIEGLLNQYGFDLYQGVYHRVFYQRKSLVCDLVEPFRPMVDSRIQKGYALGQVKESDFDIVQGQYRLFGKKAEPYIRWILEEILLYKEHLFRFVQGYYRAFMRDKPIHEYPVFNKFG